MASMASIAIYILLPCLWPKSEFADESFKFRNDLLVKPQETVRVVLTLIMLLTCFTNFSLSNTLHNSCHIPL